MVGSAYLDTESMSLRASMQGSSHGTQGLGEDHVGPAMQDPRELGVSLYRHGRDDALRRELHKPDSHFHDECANTALTKPAKQVRWNPRCGEFVGIGYLGEIVVHGN